LPSPISLSNIQSHLLAITQSCVVLRVVHPGAHAHLYFYYERHSITTARKILRNFISAVGLQAMTDDSRNQYLMARLLTVDH